MKNPCGGCCSTRISAFLTFYTFLKKGDEGANSSISKIEIFWSNFLVKRMALTLRQSPCTSRMLRAPADARDLDFWSSFVLSSLKLSFYNNL